MPVPRSCTLSLARLYSSCQVEIVTTLGCSGEPLIESIALRTRFRITCCNRIGVAGIDWRGHILVAKVAVDLLLGEHSSSPR